MADIKNKNELKRRIELFMDELDYSINEEFCKETMLMMREFIGRASHLLDCADAKIKKAKRTARAKAIDEFAERMMKEFIDKLIERLGRLGWVYADYYPDETVIHRKRKKSVAYDDVISIVNELAEEYKAEHIVDLCNQFCDKADEILQKKNNGWIPCSVRLPDTSEWSPSTIGKYFLVSCEVDSESDPWVLVKLFEKKTSKFCCDCGKVIAWQPLPAPYTEGE